MGQDAGSGVEGCLPDKAMPLYCQLLSDKERGWGTGDGDGGVLHQTENGEFKHFFSLNMHLNIQQLQDQLLEENLYK